MQRIQSQPTLRSCLQTRERWAAWSDSWFKTCKYSTQNSDSALHSPNTQHTELGRKLALGTPLSVTLLLKKKNLDPDNPASFRPISNLHTISKVLERLFLSRISPHIESSQNFNRFQPAYRRGFSTETAILRMLIDVHSAADDRRRSMIVLLDVSAAFDTIDISTLLCHLEHTFGISGLALLWLKTYLEGRTQYVRVGSDRSSTVSCEFGVPEGSVLGPMLSTTYIAPIAGVVSSFWIHHTQYADDTQLYIELRDSDIIPRLSKNASVPATAGSRRMASPSIQINRKSL